MQVIDDSFELLSSMSPKFTTSNNYKKRNRVPTVLSLKRHLKKSLVLDNKKSSKNDSLVIVEESSSETNSNSLSGTTNENIMNSKSSVILISDSENSEIFEIKDSISSLKFNHRDQCSLSETKFEKVAQWVAKVNKEYCPVDDFDSIYAKAKTSTSNDTVEIGNLMVSKNDDILYGDKKEKEVLYVDDSFLREKEVICVDDSFHPKSSSVEKRSNDKEVFTSKNLSHSSNDSDESVKNILDSVYGESWRKKQNSILCRSDKPKKCKTQEFILPKSFTAVKTKSKTNSTSIQKSKIPWVRSLKEICDPDTSSCSESHEKIDISNIRTKLDFKEVDDPCTPIKNTNFNIQNVKTPSINNKISKEEIYDSAKKDLNSFKGRLLKILQTEEAIRNEQLNKNCDETDVQNNVKEIISEPKICPKKKKKRRPKIAEKEKNTSDSESSNDFPKKLKDKNTFKKKEDDHDVRFKKYRENGKNETFLSSLSGVVPMSRCDPSARIFRTNFKSLKEKLVEKLFSLYNEHVFENQIPSDTQIQWNDRMRGSAGFCHCIKKISKTGQVTRKVRISLATKILDSADRLRDTLIHEMCHAASWIINELSDGHGAIWKSWAEKAMRTFPELPPIKRCHNYQINTKYTYRCTECGYCIGRHSKSLNIERKRCGYCYGTFEILINKKNKAGELKSVPVTPKKALNGFALFVKDNYATVKTPQLNHGDVMRLLGQKFAEMKVQSTNS